MIRINLLSPGTIKKEERSDILAIAYFFLVLLVIAAVANYALKLRTYNRVEGRLTVVDQELGKYESVVRQVDTLQATKKVLEMKRNVINTLLSSGLIYPRFMEDLLQMLPGGVSFRTMTTRLDAEGKMSVNLSADAVDNYSIADFMSALGASADFSAVELGTITASAAAGKAAISSFNLTFAYQKKKS